MLNGAVPDSPRNEAVSDLLQRWASLSDLERRVFTALSSEISSTSGMLESSVVSISDGFRELAGLAQDQSRDVGAVIETANFVVVEQERIPLDQLTKFVTEVLVEIVAMIASLSDHAKTMVVALDDALSDVVRSESAIDQIENINQKTRYLALNALIEASRAGEHGRGFAVVANEVRELSTATNGIAVTVREQITSISRRVRSGHAILKEVAGLDMRKQLAAKQRLDTLMAALTAQNRTFNITLAGAASRSQAISDAVANLVMDLQFQDRATQSLAHVTATLGVLGGTLAELQEATKAAGFVARDDVTDEWLERIMARHTLSDVRDRFANLADGSQPAAGAGARSPRADHSGSVELF